jgi:hypothetical protein
VNDFSNVGTENIRPGDARALLKKDTWIDGAFAIVIVTLLLPVIASGFVAQWAYNGFLAGMEIAQLSIDWFNDRRA